MTIENMFPGTGRRIKENGTVINTADLIESMALGKVTESHTVATIGAASGTVLAANASRKSALFINDSDAVIYLSIDGTNAELNDGVRLNANGGSYEMSAALGNLTTGIIKGISSAADKKLLVTEGV